MSALARTTLALVLPLVLPLGLVVVPACKGSRQKLEQLVPDGATGMVSIEVQPFLKSNAYGKLIEFAKASDPKVGETMDRLKNDCALDYEAVESYVVGFDALSQSFMGAVRWPNVGKAESLQCVLTMIKERSLDEPFKLGEEDGKTTIEFEDGAAIGWATDHDTVVISSKGWVSAVKQRIAGEGKSAVDNYLKDAVAMADTGAHAWMAGEMPPIAKPFLDATPAKGIERGAMSVKVGDDLEVAVAVQFAEAGQATELKAEIDKQLEMLKGLAATQGVPKEMFESLEIKTDGAKLTGTITVPLDKLIEETTKSFSSYIDKSKTSEAKVMLSKMFDGASSYFNEEHVERRAVAVLGADGDLEGVTPHRCPANQGQDFGSSGVVPPLAVDCSKGPGGKCVPVVGGSTEPGHYDMSLWTDNDVFNGLNFQMEEAHYFHYAFRYKNDPVGFGSCQFTAQAFGDLDGDSVFSTFERAGAADQNGVNAAAGLYIDQERE